MVGHRKHADKHTQSRCAAGCMTALRIRTLCLIARTDSSPLPELSAPGIPPRPRRCKTTELISMTVLEHLKHITHLSPARQAGAGDTVPCAFNTCVHGARHILGSPALCHSSVSFPTASELPVSNLLSRSLIHRLSDFAPLPYSKRALAAQCNIVEELCGWEGCREIRINCSG